MKSHDNLIKKAQNSVKIFQKYTTLYFAIKNEQTINPFFPRTRRFFLFYKHELLMLFSFPRVHNSSRSTADM